MGILDFLDDPNSLAAILGGGSAFNGGGSVGGSAPTPPAPLPPQQGSGIGSDFASSAPRAAPGGMNSPSADSGVIGNPAGDVSAMPSPGMFSANDPSMPPQKPDFGPGGVPLPPSDPRQANAGQVPLPPPRPPMPPEPIVGTPLPPAQGSNDMSARAPVPGAPLNLVPPQLGQTQPPIPPMSTNGAPPTMTQGGGLAAALGIDPNRLRSALAGVGKGMSAVGALPAGAGKGQALAAGLGGSLTGQNDARTKQEQMLFNNSSTAFKDMLAAKASDNTEGYRAAQSKYLTARAASLMAGGTASGSRAWQNTDYGKTIQVENEAQKYEKGQQILLQKQWSTNGASPEQQQKDLEGLNKNVEAYRQRLYKQIGIDPNKADKLKDMGTTATNPFDTKGMSIEQFHQMVPMGGWFKDQNGVVRQRTVPPPGSNAQPSAATPQQVGANEAPPQQPAANAAPNNDDYTAMQPAA